MEIIFFCFLFLVLYIYFGYLLSIYIISKIFPLHHHISDTYFPRVGIIIPTRNEELNIVARIENCLALDYPKEKLQILVVDSNSTDGTVIQVQGFTSTAVELLSVDHKGKAYAMEKGIEYLTTSEVIISTDANAFFEKDVVKKIVRHFSDSCIGGVTGAMKQVDKTHTDMSKSGDIYWTIEKYLRKCESKFHSCISLSGEISSFRRELLVGKKWYHKGHPDDFDITLFLIKNGKRVIYEDEAFVWEKAPDIEQDVEKQKLRIIVQTLHALFYYARLLLHSRYGFILLSHKVLPILSPLFLFGLFVTNIFLLHSGGGYVLLFLLQSIVYTFFILRIQYGFLRIPYFIVFLNVVICKAYVQFFLGVDFTKWDKIMSSRK